jgi:hypothetical protein
MIANKRLLFLLADENGLIYYRENGVTKKSALKKWLKKNPNGWKDITLQWATNEKYFSTIRAFSTALKFVEDGKDIILDRLIKGKGTEEVMYLIILRQDPSGGVNYYKFEYKSRLDFSKAEPDVRTGLSVNMLQDDVFSLVQADENTKYSIPCNSSNPAAIKVLFDGLLMQDKLNYDGLDLNVNNLSIINRYCAVPLTFINNEGDSVGIINNSTNPTPFQNVITYVTDPSNTNYIFSSTRDITLTFKGTLSANVTNIRTVFANITLAKSTDNGTTYNARPIAWQGTIAPGVNVIPINYTINLLAGEKLHFIFQEFITISAPPSNVNWKESRIGIIFASQVDPSIAYGVRPLDLLQQLVSKISNGKYTANSKFFANNNRKVILSGSSLRGFTDAQIQTSFADWFQSYTSSYNLGVTVRGGVLWVEPIEDIYNSNRQLLDLGEVSNYKLSVAEQFIYTSAKFGYQKQNYNKRNGRYEFNCIHNYKFPIYTVLNQLNRVSPYHAAPFIMEFIRMDLQNLSSTDDKGDNEVFTAMISDSVGQTDGNISTAISFTVETLTIAAPIIKSPYSGATVYNNQPTITGVSQVNMTITVYIDGIVDGTTTADLNGNWAYQVQQQLQSLSVNGNGVHRIEATASASGNNSGFSKELSIIVDTQSTSAFIITSPTNNDTLYNNLPFISGTAPAGSVVAILIDSSPVATATANTSSLWGHQLTAPLSDAAHTITATSPSLPSAPAITITVNKNVSSPLITSVVYGDVIFSNQPTIHGVAQAGVTVSVYLDGGGGPIVSGVRGPLGTVVADANGDWSFHVTTVVDASGVTTAYIPDGQHIISTTPTPVNVLAAISGYKLMRGSNKGPVMDYDVIKLDDEYIPPGIDPSSLPPTLGQFLHPETLFNIEETTPLRMLRAHDNILKSFLVQQPGEKITFNGAELNANLVTKKNGVVFNEGADVPVFDLKNNLYLNFFLNFKAKVPFTFNEIMTGVNNDGYITVSCKGIPVYCLPVGSMSMKLATNEAQNWKLLVSGKTPFDSLIKIFSDPVIINIGPNMIYISDKNPLHFVRYNFTPPAGYHIADLYDDWQKNRYPTWAAQPDYVQKVQKGDPLPIQFSTNGVSGLQLLMVSCTTGLTVDTIVFNPVPGLVAPLPIVIQQCDINTNAYPEDQYWFAVVASGTIVAITEKVDLRTDWPDTLKIEYGGSKDTIDYYFSTGIQPMIRVQGQLLPLQQGAEVEVYEDEEGDYEMTRGVPTDFREIQFGNQFSLISDWMARKLNSITLLSNWRVEGTQYTRYSDSKWDKQDFGVGVPEVMVKMAITLGAHQLGVNISTPGDSGIQTTAYVLDATAFGPTPGVVNVTAEP